jgi:hypothetical protein
MRVSFSIFFPFPTPDTNLLQLLFKRLGMNGAILSLKIAYFLKVGINFFQATYYLFIYLVIGNLRPHLPSSTRLFFDLKIVKIKNHKKTKGSSKYREISLHD